jgi:hypothetical protein
MAAFSFALLCAPVLATAQEAIYDEAKVPQYTLPDPLVTNAGEKVTDKETWITKRRPEILKLFQTDVYGRSPSKPTNEKFELRESDDKALDGLAIRKQIAIKLTGNGKEHKLDLLLYLPAAAKKPVPVFIGLNFGGNQAIHADPKIVITESWTSNNDKDGYVDHHATEKTRGIHASRWPVEAILKRGYGVATIYCGDIDPDTHDNFQNGVHALFDKPGQTRAGDEWGTIAAWAWGLSRGFDYLETDKDVDAKKVAVLGHSRLGKTSLWAGAEDERFAIVISNDSGCGGAALSRREFGETVKRINTVFPHWFCDNFKKYNGREKDLPIDHHELIALIAPRPVYIASATEDLWADPRGEFLSGKYAEPVYQLFGEKGLGVDEPPPPDKPVGDFIGYHNRTGKHDITLYDWERYMDFADKHYGRK